MLYLAKVMLAYVCVEKYFSSKAICYSCKGTAKRIKTLTLAGLAVPLLLSCNIKRKRPILNWIRGRITTHIIFRQPEIPGGAREYPFTGQHPRKHRRDAE